MNLGHRFISYIRARFPAGAALVYSVLFISTVAKFYSMSIGWAGVCAIVIVFLFFLRLRLLDEIKDYRYDIEHHSDRPVARGLLSLAELKVVVAFIFVLEVIILLGVPAYARGLWALALVYSAFMYHDFFIRSRGTVAFTMLLIMHHFVFVLYALFAVAAVSGTEFIFDRGGWALLVFLLTPTLCFEIGRKLEQRYNPAGIPTDDTYAFRWGTGVTYSIVLIILYLQVAAYFVLVDGRLPQTMPFLLLTLGATALPFFNQKYGVHTARYWTVALPLFGLLSFALLG